MKSSERCKFAPAAVQMDFSSFIDCASSNLQKTRGRMTEKEEKEVELLLSFDLNSHWHNPDIVEVSVDSYLTANVLLGWIYRNSSEVKLEHLITMSPLIQLTSTNQTIWLHNENMNNNHLIITLSSHFISFIRPNTTFMQVHILLGVSGSRCD